MDIKFSDYLAIAALITSGLSVLYTKRQSEASKSAAITDYYGQLSVQHARYREALAEVREKHKADLAKLSELAQEAPGAITESTDEYDVQGKTSRLPHTLYECSDMAFYVFKGQLAWQTGLNIAHRFHSLANIEYHLNPKVDHFGSNNFRQVVRDLYLKNPNAYMEANLATDMYFCSLVSELKARIDPSKRVDFIMGIQRDITSFNAELENAAPRFRESVDFLEELIEEGEADHFSLQQSPQWYSKIKRTKAALDTLSRVRIQAVTQKYAAHYENYVSLCIHTCAVLHAVQGVRRWGWD